MGVRSVRAQIMPGSIYAAWSLKTNGFTIGRDYAVVRSHAPWGRAVDVVNDNGDTRTVIPDGSPSAHIVGRTVNGLQISVGCFVESTAIVRDPNNLRNRYRRYRSAWRAYQWAGATTFRDWAQHSAPDSYSAPQFPETFASLLLRKNGETRW